MTDLNKIDMTHIWASAGDRIIPDDMKIDNGWNVEVPTHQEINWQFNRLDNNVAYLMQKGFPEWDATTQYIVNKSYVQHLGVVYKAIQTGVNKNPATEAAYWVVAFQSESNGGGGSGPLDSVVGYDGAVPYFTSPTTASTIASTVFGRSVVSAPTANELVDTVNTDYPANDKFGDAILFHTFNGDLDSYQLIGIGDCGVTGRHLQPRSGNLNTLYTYTGKFITESFGVTGLPSGWSQGVYIVEMSGGHPQPCVQTIKSLTDGKEASRTYTGTAWTSWIETTGVTTALASTVVKRGTDGSVTASSFTGSGTNLTNIPPSAISSTIPVSKGGTGVTTSTGTGSVVLSASPALTGTPTVPTAAFGVNTTQAASCQFVQSAVSNAVNSFYFKMHRLYDSGTPLDATEYGFRITIVDTIATTNVPVPVPAVGEEYVEYEFYNLGTGTLNFTPATVDVNLIPVCGTGLSFPQGTGCRIKHIGNSDFLVIHQ